MIFPPTPPPHSSLKGIEKAKPSHKITLEGESKKPSRRRRLIRWGDGRLALPPTIGAPAFWRPCLTPSSALVLPEREYRRLSLAGARQERHRTLAHHDHPWTLGHAPDGPMRPPALAVERAGNSKTVVVVPVFGGVPVAVGGAQEPRFAVPGTAAQHARPAILAPNPCTPIRRRALIIIMPTVLHPFPDITVYII